MGNVDFVKLASYCIDEYRKTVSADGQEYIRTYCFAIKDDGSVISSMTPHILSDAKKCILIHEKKKYAVTILYSWFYVQYIDETGCVHDEKLDNNYRLYITNSGAYSNQVMNLTYCGINDS